MGGRGPPVFKKKLEPSARKHPRIPSPSALDGVFHAQWSADTAGLPANPQIQPDELMEAFGLGVRTSTKLQECGGHTSSAYSVPTQGCHRPTCQIIISPVRGRGVGGRCALPMYMHRYSYQIICMGMQTNLSPVMPRPRRDSFLRPPATPTPWPGSSGAASSGSASSATECGARPGGSLPRRRATLRS